MISVDEIKRLMNKVNNYHLNENPDSGNCAWERGTYFIGCLAAYEITKEKKYYDYALKWAKDNNWSLHRRGIQENWWKSADNTVCAQSYLKLLDIDNESGTMKNILEDMELFLADTKNDYWWWVDTIYMALPFYNMMGIRYADDRYFEKAHSLFTNSKTERSCYNREEGLWYRDERLQPPLK